MALSAYARDLRSFEILTKEPKEDIKQNLKSQPRAKSEIPPDMLLSQKQHSQEELGQYSSESWSNAAKKTLEPALNKAHGELFDLYRELKGGKPQDMPKDFQDRFDAKKKEIEDLNQLQKECYALAYYAKGSVGRMISVLSNNPLATGGMTLINGLMIVMTLASLPSMLGWRSGGGANSAPQPSARQIGAENIGSALGGSESGSGPQMGTAPALPSSALGPAPLGRMGPLPAAAMGPMPMTAPYGAMSLAPQTSPTSNPMIPYYGNAS